MSRPVIVAGYGPSINGAVMPEDMPLAAVSGAIAALPQAEMLITIDGPSFFPSVRPQTQKHVPDWQDGWWTHSNVTRWAFDNQNVGYDEPGFKAGDRIAQGLPGRNHSLLFAVQLLPQCGYDELHFIGVDLLSVELSPINECLMRWANLARRAGVTWINHSPLSRLAEWMGTTEYAEA